MMSLALQYYKNVDNEKKYNFLLFVIIQNQIKMRGGKRKDQKDVKKIMRL